MQSITTGNTCHAQLIPCSVLNYYLTLFSTHIYSDLKWKWWSDFCPALRNAFKTDMGWPSLEPSWAPEQPPTHLGKYQGYCIKALISQKVGPSQLWVIMYQVLDICWDKSCDNCVVCDGYKCKEKLDCKDCVKIVGLLSDLWEQNIWSFVSPGHRTPHPLGLS